ncbi:hypothetical protein ACWA5Z_07665 [Testudinibacter sp. P80/BLE/0925]|uniref:hypothetical protein n=1 Tax=Testudinibacter sp. TW-1 TaxID=3417757 RepID=UPI003D35DFC0
MIATANNLSICINYHLFQINVISLLILVIVCACCYFISAKEKYFIWCAIAAIAWLTFIYSLLTPDLSLFYNGIPPSKLSLTFLISFTFVFNLFLRDFTLQRFTPLERYSFYFIAIFLLLLYLVPYVIISSVLSITIYLGFILFVRSIINTLFTKAKYVALLNIVLSISLLLGSIEFLKYLGFIDYEPSLILLISLFLTISLTAIVLLRMLSDRRYAGRLPFSSSRH